MPSLPLSSIVGNVTYLQSGFAPANTALIIPIGSKTSIFDNIPGAKPLNSLKSTPVAEERNGIFPTGTLFMYNDL